MTAQGTRMSDFPDDLDSPLGVCASLSYPTPQGSDVSWRQMQPDSHKRARPRPFCLALSVGADTHMVWTEPSPGNLLTSAEERMHEHKRVKKTKAKWASERNAPPIRREEPASARTLLPDPGVPKPAPTATSQQRRIPRRGKTWTVLLVEDEKTLRTVLHMTLERNGYGVLEAGDGKEALELAETHKGEIDLLLADVMMPGMNGTELVAALAATIPNLPVLYMSGYKENTLLRLHIDCSGAPFLEKPFRPQDLIAKIEALLAAPPVVPEEGEPAGSIDMPPNPNRTS